MPIEHVFAKQRDALQSKFLSCIKKQFVLEVHKYYNDFARLTAQHCNEEEFIEVNDIYKIASQLDPEADD